MAGEWTEDWDNFGAAGTGWQNYDIYTNKSIPKGAVVYIVCCHGEDATEQLLGVRTDGSSLSRYVDVHECEGSETGTAYRCVSMYVTVHASTGYIETYCEDTSEDIFYIMGYWEGVTYYEKANEYGLPDGDDGWASQYVFDYYTNYSIPKGAVCEVFVGHNRTAMSRRGIRTEGTSTDRQDYMNEVEDGGYNGFTFIVKTDETNGKVREYCNNGVETYCFSKVLGYFDTNMDFVQGWTQGTFSTSDSWNQHWDLTSYIDSDGDIVHMHVSHNYPDWARYFGVRVDGSSDDKRIYLGESESGRTQGFTTPCPTNSSTGQIEVYCDDAARDWIFYEGYYVPPVSQEWYKDLSENISPTNTISKFEMEIFKSQTINPTSAISKSTGKFESESVTPTVTLLSKDFYKLLEEGMKRILRWQTP